ncbi:unnamed protein product [Symbiodinium microadriaticum]|nr:unnamed protein product [Symbiodinium microadriaticum]
MKMTCMDLPHSNWLSSDKFCLDEPQILEINGTDHNKAATTSNPDLLTKEDMVGDKNLKGLGGCGLERFLHLGDYASGKEVQPEETRGGLVSDVQHFINMARKAEGRVKSLTQNRRQREAQWEKYVHDMKATLQHEHQRHQQSLSKLDEDLQLAYQHQEESRTRLCQVIEVSMGKRLPEAGRPSDQQWENMVSQWEQESIERCNPLEVVRRAYTANPPPDFGANSVPMPAAANTAPNTHVDSFVLDPSWGPGPPSCAPSAPPPVPPPQPTPPDVYLGSATPMAAPTVPPPPAPHGVGVSPGARERVDGARGTVKARTPPQRQDPGLSLSAKLASKRNALKPFGGAGSNANEAERPVQDSAPSDAPPEGSGGLSAVPENGLPSLHEKDTHMETHDLS